MCSKVVPAREEVVVAYLLDNSASLHPRREGGFGENLRRIYANSKSKRRSCSCDPGKERNHYPLRGCDAKSSDSRINSSAPGWLSSRF